MSRLICNNSKDYPLPMSEYEFWEKFYLSAKHGRKEVPEDFFSEWVYVDPETTEKIEKIKKKAWEEKKKLLQANFFKFKKVTLEDMNSVKPAWE